MKITGNSEHINELFLSLKSMNTRLNLFVEPFPYADRLDLERQNSVAIIFEDSREIDMLINALQKFKEQNERYIGYWK